MTESTVYDEYFSLDFEHIVLLGVIDPFDGVPGKTEIQDLFDSSDAVPAEQLHSELETALEIVLGRQTFDTGVYGYDSETDQWHHITTHDVYLDVKPEILQLTDGDIEDYVELAHDEFGDALSQLADEIDSQIETGHGWDVARALAQHHFIEVGWEEYDLEDYLNPVERAADVLMREWQIGKREAHRIANELADEGVLTTPEDYQQTVENTPTDD